MIITDIKREGKGLYALYSGDELIFTIHRDVFDASGFKEGDNAADEALEELKAISEEKLAGERALRLLSAREYTSGGLMRKLLERFDDEASEKAVEKMRELGLIDDMDYARRYASDCVRLKGFSPKRAQRALIEKGVPRDIAIEAAEELEGDPAPRIAAVVCKKYMSGLDTEKGRIRAVNALIRLGYGYGEVRRVIENLLDDEDYYADG